MRSPDGAVAIEAERLGVVLPAQQEHFFGSTIWTCEKWSEDACDFVRRNLGIDLPEDVSSANLRKIVGPAEELIVIEGNLLLNEGIARVLDLAIGAGGTAYNAAGAFIGVGDSNTAESASQTDLQAASNHFYKGMNATYPSRASQTLSFQSDFTSAEANYAWAEWTISAGATSASGSGFLVGTTNLNRKVSALGTKATGTWTLTGQVTLS